MANPHRGEVALVLAGRTFVCRPTFEALVEVEDRTGLALIELGRRILENRARMRDLATLIQLTAKAGGHGPTLAEVGALLVEEGLTPELVAGLGQLVLNAIGGTRARAEDAPPANPPAPSPTASTGSG